MKEFLEHVKQGLSQSPKKIPSRYLYDTKGDKLFQQIMQLEEYYPPQCERQIITEKSATMAADIAREHSDLQIIELGAGDGTKTKLLVSEFKRFFNSLDYLALDISESILEVNKKEIEREVSGINAQGIAGNYFNTFNSIPTNKKGRLLLFLGGNIGNYLFKEAVELFEFLKKGLKENDALLVAFDLVKDPRKIIAAYDDSQGVTKAFNLNLLERMNRELGANFKPSKFKHFPYYNPVTGLTASHIVSLEKQSVLFQDGFEAHFESFEAIHTEISKKYFQKEIKDIADRSGLEMTQTYYDTNKDYAFVLFTKTQE